MKKRMMFSLIIFALLSSCNADGTIKEKRPEVSSYEQALPQGLTTANQPVFPIGSSAIIQTKQNVNMHGSKAMINGAFDTTAYSISYKPTDSDHAVWNYHWVIQEEILDAGDKTLEPGTHVTLKTNRIKGMDGARATIESAEETTVYIVDINSGNNANTVTGYRWITENELMRTP